MAYVYNKEISSIYTQSVDLNLWGIIKPPIKTECLVMRVWRISEISPG